MSCPNQVLYCITFILPTRVVTSRIFCFHNVFNAFPTHHRTFHGNTRGSQTNPPVLFRRWWEAADLAPKDPVYIFWHRQAQCASRHWLQAQTVVCGWVVAALGSVDSPKGNAYSSSIRSALRSNARIRITAKLPILLMVTAAATVAAITTAFFCLKENNFFTVCLW